MSQIDQKFTLGSSSIEFHVGNAPSLPGQANGQNPLPPVDAPIIGPKVQAPGGTILSKTVGSSRFQNPA
jgi:hypothetical protein